MRTAARFAATFALGIILASAPARSADPPALEPLEVGPHGDLRQLQFAGNRHFSAAAIRRGLDRDAHVLLHSRRHGSLYTLRKTLETRILAGYRLAGFADAQVEVFWNSADACLRANLVEGRQYTTGEILVEGVNESLTQSIRHWLTQPYPPEGALPSLHRSPDGSTSRTWTTKEGKRAELEDPLFPPGETARLSAANDQKIDIAVKRALADHAYHQSLVHTRTVSHAPSGTVGLHVHVEDLGPQAHIDELRITGNLRDTPEEILRHLQLETGQLATQQRLVEIWSGLWESARYQHFDVDMTEPVFPTDPVELRIALREYPEAPPLREPLSETQHVLLRAGQWLNRLPESRLDILLDLKVTPGRNTSDNVRQASAEPPDAETDLPPSGLALAASGTDGIVVSLFGPHPLTRQPTRLTLVARGRTLHLYHHSTRLHYALPLGGKSRVNWAVDIRGLKEPKSHEDRVGSNFSLNATSAPKNGELDNVVSGGVTVSPMAALDLGRGRISDDLPEPGFITIQRDDVSIIIEKSTGRLVEAAGTTKFDDGLQEIRIRPAPDGIAQLTRQLLPDADEYVTLSDPRHRLASGIALIGRVLGEDPGPLDADRFRKYRALLSILERACARVEEHAANPDHDGPQFTTPKGDIGLASWVSNFTVAVTPMISEVFGRDTPYDRAGRAMAALVAFQDKAAVQELNAIVHSDKSGPLLLWYCAEGLRWFHPPAAAQIAEVGLRTLQPQRARHDLQHILEGDGLLKTTLVEIIHILRDTPHDDLTALLTGGLDETTAARIAAVCRDESRSPEAAATEMLSLAWPRLQPLLQTRLEALRALTQPTPD